MSGRRDAAYEWGTAEDEKPDYRVLPTTLPAPPFHCGPSDRPSNTRIQGPVTVCQTSFKPRLESLRQARSYQRNHAVGTTASANTLFSLRSPSCPVPVCDGNEVFVRPAFGVDMRFGVTAMGGQQSMTRKPRIHQRHLPAVVGTAASANTPLSLRSPSCPVPVCNGNEVFTRPAFGLHMRFGVTAMGV